MPTGSLSPLSPSSSSAPVLQSPASNTHNPIKIDVGGNVTAPVVLDAAQKAKLGPVNTALENIRGPLEGLVLKYVDRDPQDELTWFRCDFARNLILYQLNNQPEHYVLDLGTVVADHPDANEEAAYLVNEVNALKGLVADLTGKPISHIPYEKGQTTITGGMQPFQKQGTPALEALGKAAFKESIKKVEKQALDLLQVKRSRTMQAKQKAVQGTIERTITRLEQLKTNVDQEIDRLTRQPNHPRAELDAVRDFRKELDKIDGYAIGLTALHPTVDYYDEAIRVENELAKRLFDCFTEEERAAQTVSEKLTKKWERWFPPSSKEMQQRVAKRRRAAEAYAADVADLVFKKSALTNADFAILRAASRGKTGSSVEHRLVNYLCAPPRNNVNPAPPRNNVRPELFMQQRNKSIQSLADHFQKTQALTRTDAQALAQSIVPLF